MRSLLLAILVALTFVIVLIFMALGFIIFVDYYR